jgi:uncharacterized protein (TIGR03083 family)
VPTTVDDAVALIRATARPVVAMLGRAAPGSLARPAIGSWSGRDVAAHLAGIAWTYTDLVGGGRSPVTELGGISAWNQATVAERAATAPAELAAELGSGIDTLATAAGRVPAGTEVTWHGGVRLDLPTLLAVLATELLVHGHDIGKATGTRWVIPPGQARAAFAGQLPLLPHFVDRAGAARVGRCTWDVVLRGGPGASARLTLADGALTIGEAGGPGADCLMKADPAAFLLVSYGRRNPVAAALTGKVSAGGRRPWKALALNRVLSVP